MTRDPVCLGPDASAVEAARQMRDHDIGDVLVVEDDRVRGIVTDRDLVVRVLAEGHGPDTSLSGFSSRELTTVSPDDDVADVARLMAQKAIRRVPVVQDDRLVGIVSIGDLAVDQDRRSVLGTISAAPPDK